MQKRIADISKAFGLSLCLFLLAACGGGGGGFTGNGDADSGGSDDVGVEVDLLIDPSPLANGNVGVPYVDVLTASGGVEPYRWAVLDDGGQLPPGLAVLENGVVSGTPTAAGTYSFLVEVSGAGSAATVRGVVTMTVSGGLVVQPVADSVLLLAGKPQLASSGANALTLTAYARDVNNVAVEGVPVSFATSDTGVLIELVRPITDATGAAEAKLSLLGNKANRTVTVTATASGPSDSVDVAVAGTTIAATGPRAVTTGASVTLQLALRDSAGTGIGGEVLTVTADGGLTPQSATATTDVNGQASVVIAAVATGTVFVAGAGASAAYALEVSPDNFTLSLQPGAGVDVGASEIDLGAAATITATWLQNGLPLAGQAISFSTTRGVLSANTAVTDAAGQAAVTISSANAGAALVSAEGPAGAPGAQMSLLFVATVPATLDLQVSPAVIGINPAGGPGTEQATVTAIVRDPMNNPVANQDIDFVVDDITGGTLSSGVARTDAAGRALVTYTAGPLSSALNGVGFTATVRSAPGVTDTAALTVNQSPLFITLGTGNSVAEPDETTYALPYSVLVSDASGAPLVNQQVSLSVVPTVYRKGYREFQEPPGSWVTVYTIPTPTLDPGQPNAGCFNEDVNRNGVFEPAIDVDYNGNGRLEPGNVVVATPANVTTDANGFAFFDLRYAQDLAYYIDVRLTARAGVGGTETVESVDFSLPGIASDFNSGDKAPPGIVSRYGTSTTCADVE